MSRRQSTFSDRISHLFWVILFGFGVVALGLVYWSVIRAPDILAREDNPRLFEAELRVERGSILDRYGYELAASRWNEERQVRLYDHEALSPAVGYYSLRYGTAGIEQSLDATLRGELQAVEQLTNQLLHHPATGQDVRLTLDAAVQGNANNLMDGQSGALVLLEIVPGVSPPEVRVRAMTSVPGYDPADLDSSFDALSADENAPLVNRAAQGLYQPGMMLQPFVLSGAVTRGLISLDDAVTTPDLSVPVDGHVMGCQFMPEETESELLPVASWTEVLSWGCPAPMAQLGERMGAQTLDAIWKDFGLTTAPSLAIPTAGNLEASVEKADLAALGQDTLTVTPLQAALALAMLGSDGIMPQLRLVEAVETRDGTWEPWQLPAPEAASPVVDPQHATAILQSLSEENRIAGRASVVLSAPEGGTNTWYVGAIPAEAPRYVVALVLEDSDDATLASQIGGAILESTLSYSFENEADSLTLP